MEHFESTKSWCSISNVGAFTRSLYSITHCGWWSSFWVPRMLLLLVSRWSCLAWCCEASHAAWTNVEKQVVHAEYSEIILSFVCFIELGSICTSMLQETLMVAIHYRGNNGVGFDGAIHVNKKAFGEEPNRFNMVISLFLFLGCYPQLDCILNLFF